MVQKPHTKGQSNNLETFSIVTATINQGHLIGETIESVISQKGDFSIEYVVMDGLSTDNTLKVLQKYKEQLDNGTYPIQCNRVVLRFKSEKDSGQSNAMNKAIALTTGEIIGEISSDDYYLPGAFDAAMRFLREHSDTNLVYGDCLKIYNDERKPTFEPKPRPHETFWSILNRGSFSFAMQASFFKKRILDEIGGFFDENLHYCPDLDFFLRVFRHGTGHYIPFPMAVFRIWEGSKTGAHPERFAAERKTVAKRFGGNIIPSQSIYALRDKLSFLDYAKKNSPGTYAILKRLFYRAVNAFKYRASASNK